MKKFLLKVLLFFACVVVMDFAMGYGFSLLRSHAKGGSTANCEYIANRANEDIIILGSSRATHHYVPQIIEDSLGVSCYNCGEEGNGVVLAYGRLKMLSSRYKPKLVLYEITPGYDYGTAEPNSKYLGYLRAYYNKEGIREIFDDFSGKISRLKLMSKMYQNTSRLLPDIADNLIYRDNHKGYAPLKGKMDASQYVFQIDTVDYYAVDSLKLSYLEKVILLAQSENIPILFMISPRYGKDGESLNYEPAMTLCEKHGVQVFNYVECPGISDKVEFFQDAAHMNHDGAVTYTNMLITDVLKHYFY